MNRERELSLNYKSQDSDLLEYFLGFRSSLINFRYINPISKNIYHLPVSFLKVPTKKEI